MLANREVRTLPWGEQDTLPLESQQGEVTWFLKPQHCMGAKLQAKTKTNNGNIWKPALCLVSLASEPTFSKAFASSMTI